MPVLTQGPWRGPRSASWAPLRWPSASGLTRTGGGNLLTARGREFPARRHSGTSRAGQTQLIFFWDVLPSATTPTQRLVFSWDVRTIAAITPRLVFTWNVLRPDQRLIFLWDVIPLALFDAASEDIQRPVTSITRTPSSEFFPTAFEVSGNLSTPAEMWRADITGTGLYRTRTPHDRFTLRAGLLDPAGNAQLYTVIKAGIPNDRMLTLVPGKGTARISGRDQMAYLLDGLYSRIYRYGPSPEVIAGQRLIPESNGLYWASEIARAVVSSGGLQLAWQCPDYRIWSKFEAIGRPFDILVALVRPFSLHIARQVDVFTGGNVVYMRQRQLEPHVAPGLTISAHDLRISQFDLRTVTLPKIGRVTLRGRKKSGITTTPFGGVPIPHDTELLPIGGGGPVTIYMSLPPDAEAMLLPATGLPTDVGTVQLPDGSTLGVGQVVFTQTRIVQADIPGSWAIPIGATVRADGTISYLSAAGTVVIPPAFRYVINSDSTVTTLHPDTTLPPR